MNKKSIKLLILSATLIFSFSLFTTPSVKAADNEIKENVVQPTTIQSETEIKQAEEKLKLVDSYVKSKAKHQTRSYGSSATASFATCVQNYGNYCGPATAFNATNAANSQEVFARALKTDENGTPFPGTWAEMLNAWRPGNGYQGFWANRYGSLSNWRTKLKDCIIYTIDKGYPVVADCHITDSSSRLHPGYSYATDSWHYVTVGGYDDYPNTIPAQVLISDSHPNTATIPRTYWTSLDKLASATMVRGIIW